MNKDVHITRHEFQRYMRGCVLAFVVMLSSIGYVLSTKPDTSALNSGLRGTCAQITVIAAKANLYTVDAYENRIAAAKRERLLARAQQGLARKAHLKSARHLENQVKNLSITGIPDCDEAVSSSTYVFPSVATPIGNPKTFKITPAARRIIKESLRLVLG